MIIPPTGTITFLFSDIEGSTKKWEKQPEAMRVALAEHDRLLREAFARNAGYVFKTIGDAFCVAFDTAQSAVAGAIEAQRALREADFGSIGEIRVRMALHTGAAEHRDNDYFGQALNRVARILAAVHGGQVLVSQATEELVRDLIPAGAQLRHLGEHRLRDLARPEHLYQLVASGLPSEFASLRSLESVANNLPVQLSHFIGREREMEEVKRVLNSTRLLTLTGMGGTGKTRLSLQVAADVLEQFPDGVWFVEFATIDDALLVAETVAAALGLRQEADRPLLSTLTNYLRERNVLLILDNCEHVVAACARLAETLLRACPKLHILASSREALGIVGETAWPVPPLSLPNHWREISPGEDAVARLGHYEAVRLFVERASLASTFQLTNENAHLVAQICWRLDGIPLAIELAAARIRVLSLDKIVERLDDRFHLLTTGSRNAVPRQQTLRSLIDWSYDLLDERERMLLQRLSVFARGRTLEAIEAVCSGEGLDAFEIIDLLTQLVDKSLVYVETPEGAHEARYFILESIWDYANEKLIAAGHSDIFRIRHLEYFLRFAEAAAPKTIGADQRKWLEIVEDEAFNIRYALDAAAELPGQVEKGLRLLVATQRFVEVRGLFKEARDVFAKILALPEAAPRNAIRARAVAAAGRLAWVADDGSECQDYQKEALGLYRELGDASGIARALADLAFLALDTPDVEAARALLKEATELAEPLHDSRLTAHIQHIWAVIAAADQDFEKSMELDVENLTRYRVEGDTWQAIIMAWSVGVNAAALGKFEVARAHLTECLQVGLDLGNRWGASYPIEAFAILAVAEGNYDRAARLYGAADAQRVRSGLVSQAADHPAMRVILDAAPEFSGPTVEAARREGRQLSLEEATALALATEES